MHRPFTHAHRPKVATGLFFALWLSTTLSTVDAQVQGCRPLAIPSSIVLDNPPKTVDGIASLTAAAAALDKYMTNFTTSNPSPAVDSILVSIVTPAGSIWSKGYGRIHANETDNNTPPDIDTIYRVGSVSKLLTALETVMLRDKGALNWDDPIEKFIPEFKYLPYGWNPDSQSNNTSGPLPSLTLRQLATHMSGIGRLMPIAAWDTFPVGQPAQVIPSQEDILSAIAKTPLLAEPYSFPSYSNAGYSVLGWANVAAAKSKDATSADDFAGLIRKDIFEPLGMNSSSYLASDFPGMQDRLAFASVGNVIDFDLGEGNNPAGGQLSSAADLVKVMQMLLDPSKEGSLLTPTVVREWLRPLHVWPDDLTEVGVVWEILKAGAQDRRQYRYYQKSGDLDTYHANFAVNPELNYGIIVLTSGTTAAQYEIMNPIIEAFQPAFQGLIEAEAETLYAGNWTDGSSAYLNVQVDQGGLLVPAMVLNGTDLVTALTGKPAPHRPSSLWSTGRKDEFRVSLDFGGNDGCFTSWLSLDRFAVGGQPIDVVYFEGDGQDRVLHYPALKLVLKRA